jgi:hypothetical protein
MKCSIKNIAVGLCLAALAGAAYAGDAARDISVPSDATVLRTGDLQSFMLAANEVPASNAAQNVASAAPAKQTEYDATYSLNKAHKHLGEGTIIAALLTAMTAPDSGCETNCTTQTRDRTGTHAKLARATVALASAAIFTGVLAHWDDVHFANGISDPDNLHALLGITGAALMAKAVNKSAGSTVQVSHAAQAELGAALMAIGIKLEW